MADAADHAWTIAVATGSTPLPPTAHPYVTAGTAWTWRPATSSSPYTSITVTYICQTHSSRPLKQQLRRRKTGPTRHQRR